MAVAVILFFYLVNPFPHFENLSTFAFLKQQ